MLRRAILAMAAFAATLGVAGAIVVSMPTEPDPFARNGYCASFRIDIEAADPQGAWPTTFDLIKEPDADPQALMTCPASGYASLPDDFGPLTAEEKDRVGAYLKQVNFGPRIEDEKLGPSDAFLAHLEKIYELREKDDAFRAYFARYLAAQFKEPKAAAARRQTAFALHLQLHKNRKLTGPPLLETLYALGYYAWRMGRHEQADLYFAKLRAAPAFASESQQYREYLIGLAGHLKGGDAEGANVVVQQQPPQP